MPTKSCRCIELGRTWVASCVHNEATIIRGIPRKAKIVAVTAFDLYEAKVHALHSTHTHSTYGLLCDLTFSHGGPAGVDLAV